MGRSQHLLCAALLGLLSKGILIAAGNSAAETTTEIITVKQSRKSIILQCEADKNAMVQWKKNGKALSHTDKELPLGFAVDDPRGFYECNNSKTTDSLHVFFRMCQNCIHLNLATILGVLVASIVATFFLAVAVYCIAAEKPGQRSQASDKQTLLANEQLYQPLGDRSNGQYSHLQAAKRRHR
ncbi:T-cell surface glycoprotein CD3 gamma chain-like [Rhineura floridana]|uniref:T-cell surface glycoprotein CD3 gamma chain-like n=1 Tax=Rhineura floridana TaxID=261503 RepID=UPI002AC891CC|nr:T-cell surface glycoprotein CD3 gamma chain-like [Rhineura floridana]